LIKQDLPKVAISFREAVRKTVQALKRDVRSILEREASETRSRSIASCAYTTRTNRPYASRRLVVRQQNETLRHRLRNQHAVKGVAMMHWQVHGFSDVRERDGQRLEPVVTDCGFDIGVESKLAGSDFDGQFPSHRQTHENRIRRVVK
jgi:hypothetical protein